MRTLYSGFRISGRKVSAPCWYCGDVVVEFLHHDDITVGGDIEKGVLDEISAKIWEIAKPFSFKDEVAVVCDKCKAKLPKTKKERDLCDEWSKYYSPQHLTT